VFYEVVRPDGTVLARLSDLRDATLAIEREEPNALTQQMYSINPIFTAGDLIGGISSIGMALRVSETARVVKFDGDAPCSS
jgi:hypothetical protein